LISTLTVPIRDAEDPDFSAFLDRVGDGELDEVPLNFMKCTSDKNDLVDYVFPPEVIANPISCLTRSILAPTNRQVDDYNATILDRIDGDSISYMARDSLKEAEENNLRSPNSVLDFVSRNQLPGMPPFTLTIKKNAVYRLLRNFSIERGLVKNARVVITDVGQRLISIRVLRASLQDTMNSEIILIPRITFSTKLASGHTLLRQQFPLGPSYATTFHSCQGMTLDRIGVDLTNPVFSHGQLYTALSRIRNREAGIIRLHPGHSSTTNVTYHELLL
jgi:ATP-dependent DNA helicase PIF1